MHVCIITRSWECLLDWQAFKYECSWGIHAFVKSNYFQVCLNVYIHSYVDVWHNMTWLLHHYQIHMNQKLTTQPIKVSFYLYYQLACMIGYFAGFEPSAIISQCLASLTCLTNYGVKPTVKVLLQFYHPYLFHSEKCTLLMKRNGSQDYWSALLDNRWRYIMWNLQNYMSTILHMHANNVMIIYACW